MGYGDYCYDAHEELLASRAQLSCAEVFSQRQVHPLMNPRGVTLRESRDSTMHPNSLPIIFALDVTGSMGKIPEQLAKTELPNFMKTLLDSGVVDPQVLFMALGDALHDRGPLQVGQFESSAEEMDRWLTWSWLEGGGGGNGHESYDLAMYFAARHTASDAYQRRRKRGYFFMTGDEKPYPASARLWLGEVLGAQVGEDIPLTQVCQELTALYHPFFLIPDSKRAGTIEAIWREVLGDHVICLSRSEDTCFVAAALVALTEGRLSNLKVLGKQLRQQGLSRSRTAGIIQALTPYAATLGRDGNRFPLLQMLGL